MIRLSTIREQVIHKGSLGMPKLDTKKMISRLFVAGTKKCGTDFVQDREQINRFGRGFVIAEWL
jgi:hypothetical protein